MLQSEYRAADRVALADALSGTHDTRSSIDILDWDRAAVPSSWPWRASWSPKRSPTAGWTACAPPATRSTCGSELSADELLEAIAGAHALIIRSATTVTDEVLAAGSDLLVVGRAGIGLDNVDVEAATRRGVMVVNAPQSNIVSAAEHTMALLLAQARNVPQAHSALVAGRWERSRWEGVELADKTLGIVGLGRIGKLVADRARGFGMRLIAYDPFVSAERGRHLGVELLPLDQVVAEADFLTIHLPKTAETTGIIGRDLLLKAKPTLRDRSTSPVAASSTRPPSPTPSATA